MNPGRSRLNSNGRRPEKELGSEERVSLGFSPDSSSGYGPKMGSVSPSGASKVTSEFHRSRLKSFYAHRKQGSKALCSLISAEHDSAHTL